MNKKVKYTFKGANQDLSKSKHPFQYYFEGEHIRIVATEDQSTGSVTNEKGTELIVSLPNITIVGVENIAIVAVDDSATINAFGEIIIPVLDNDEFLYDVTITITQLPNKGTAEITGNNKIKYTDTIGDFVGDSFIYQIDDGITTDTATVTISINEVPVVDEDDDNTDPTFDDNFDGQYYLYMLNTCDNNILDFLRVRSRNKLTIDNNIVYVLEGAIGINKEGKIASKSTDFSFTPYFVRGEFSGGCEPQEDYDNPAD